MCAWVRLDDQFTDHPKVVAAGPLAGWLYVCGLTYCARLMTDGFIPTGQVRKLADVPNAQKLADALVRAGLWERSEGGFIVHDYLEYNPSRDRTLATREARAEAGSRGGKQKASNLLGRGQDDATPVAIPVASTFSKQNATPFPIPDSSLRSESPPIAPPSGGDDAKPSRKRGTRIPPDFGVNEDMYAWAESKGVTRDEADRETEGFVLYWQSASQHATKLDWVKTWKNRILDQLTAGKVGPARRNGIRPFPNGHVAQAEHNRAGQRNPDGSLRTVF